VLIQQNQKEFPVGYTSVTQIGGNHSEMLTDFGIVRIEPDHPFTSSFEDREQAFLLLSGTVRFEWRTAGGSSAFETSRSNLLEEEPTVLHVPRGSAVTLSNAGAGGGTAELAVQRVRNSRRFEPRLWKPGDYRSEQFGKGTLQDTSTRTVRTFFDAATAPESEMVLGEVVNFPGKWSSYPPHHHAQPEIYHFRFFPSQGFGFSQQGDQLYRVQNGDTVTIPPHVVHPQCAAPGYAMYYIWMIPHLPDDRFGPDSRIFVKEHEWVMDPKAPIWPDADLAKVLRNQ